MKLDALIAFTQASYRTLQVSLLNMIKTNKRISILKYTFVEYLLYPTACWLPHLRNSVYDDSSFF